MIEVGQTLGNYKILEEVGLGGMGKVYRGLDTMLDREVAIKVLRQEMTMHHSLVERFRKEAMVLAKLIHPNIALLYNLFQQGDQLFMVMEFVSGETLEWQLKRGGALQHGQAIGLFVQILDAIGYAHQHGVIHRDIKPSNIMILPDNRVKVMDFGIARVLGTERMTRDGSVIGTVEYMSPEQIRGQESSEASDIYSLGVLLFEMVSRRLPFSGQNQFDLMRAHIEDPPPSLRKFVPNIPEHIEQAVLRSLEKRKEDRFRSAGEFRAALQTGGWEDFRLPFRDTMATRPLRKTATYVPGDREEEVELAAAEARHQLIEEARKKVREEASQIAKEERQKLIEEARKQAEEEATRFVENERQRLLEDARKQAEQEANKLAEEEKQRLFEEARKQAEAEAAERAAAERQRMIEEARIRAEQEAAVRAASERLRLVEAARRQAEQQASHLAAAERQRLIEEARKRAEEEAERLAAEEERKLVEEARKKAEVDAARFAEEERRRLLEDAHKRAEQQAAERASAERKRLIDNARQYAEKEAAARGAAEFQRLLEEARKQAEEEAANVAAEEEERLFEQARKHAEEEASVLALAERTRLLEEARRRAEQEASKKASKERQRLVEAALRQAEQEAARMSEEERDRLIEEARHQAEEEATRLGEEERQRLLEEARRRAEQEASKKASKDRQRLVEAALRQAEEEAARLSEEERDRLIEEARKQAEEEAARLGEEERQRLLEEALKRAEKEAARHSAKERKRLIAEGKKRAKQEAQRQSSELIAQPDPYGTKHLSGDPSRGAQFEPGADLDLYPEERKFPLPMVVVGFALLLILVTAVAIYVTRTGTPPLKDPKQPFKPDMVHISGGTFRMGREYEKQPNEDPIWAALQIPSHEVKVEPFEIDSTEVINLEYAQFVSDTLYQPPSDWGGKTPPQGMERWPVRNVSFADVQAFAAWRSKRDSVTYRLPTEEEWEFAAKGQNNYRYPWGNEWSGGRANVETGTPKPVKSFPGGASPSGVFDMIGNVGEWTLSQATAYPGNQQIDQRTVPTGRYVVRGGSYESSPNGEKPITVTSRGFFAPSDKAASIGFRLIRPSR